MKTPRLNGRIASDFLGACEGIEFGRLRVRTPEGNVHDFGSSGLDAEFQINDWSAVSALLSRGDVGLGESYVAGHWDTPSVEALATLGLLNEGPMRRYAAPSRWNSLVFRAVDRGLRRNTPRGAARNVRAHYDVGNEFFGEWLDPGLTYSSALFADGDADLGRGQARKYDRILDRLGDRERVLEFGCGWGDSPSAPPSAAIPSPASPFRGASRPMRMPGSTDVPTSAFVTTAPPPGGTKASLRSR